MAEGTGGLARAARRFVRSTPRRTFVLYPLALLAWEAGRRPGRWRPDLRFLPLLGWGYLQYRLCRAYRQRHGGGGPGLDVPPERLVTSGPYAVSRNPMYLGHLIFTAGLALTCRSAVGGLLAVGSALWFQQRVREDERRLARAFGAPYRDYLRQVPRWLPSLRRSSAPLS